MERETEIGKLPRGASVCIVGAGSIGVYAARVAIEHGLNPTVFEESDKVGGVWQKHWSTLTTNSSVRMMSMAEPPIRLSPTLFPHKICDYVDEYAKHHKLDIKFGHKVTKVEPLPKTHELERWRVSTQRSTAAGTVEEVEEFDAVFCCHGQFNNPKWPRIPGLPVPTPETTPVSSPTVDSNPFTGKVLHSQAFADGAMCRDKDVVVVGIGNSALDIALEAVRHGARSIRMVCRNSAMILPVSDHAGTPVDSFFSSRLFVEAPNFLKQYWFFGPVLALSKRFQKAGLPPIPKGTPGLQVRISNLKEHQAWVKAMDEGKIMFSSVDRFLERQVVLSDGSVKPADVVVCCTGYHLEFPFLTPSVTDDIIIRYPVGSSTEKASMATSTLLYRRIMHPRFPSLCFFGLLTTLGNEAAVGELQSRWACSMLTGTAAVPCTQEKMVAEAESQRRRNEKLRPLFPMFATYVKYCDTLAADLGCAPPPFWTWSTLMDPYFALLVRFGPVSPAQFRLRGPHATPSAARHVIMSSKL